MPMILPGREKTCKGQPRGSEWLSKFIKEKTQISVPVERRKQKPTSIDIAALVIGVPSFAVGLIFILYGGAAALVPASFCLAVALIALCWWSGFSLAFGENRVAAMSTVSLESSEHAHNPLIQVGERLLERLLDEQNRLIARARVNFVIGTAVAVVGVLMIWFVVFPKVGDTTAATGSSTAGAIAMTRPEEPSAIVPHDIYLLLSRLSLAVITEFVAFFFLSQYRNSLADRRLLSNELSTLELRLLGVRLVLEGGDPGDRMRVAMSLMSSERNLILSKGQTTVDLERVREDRAVSKDAFDAITNLATKLKR